MAEVRGAIFDLDGTLLDTTSLWEDIDRAFFESRGLPFPDDYIDAVSSMSFEEAARYTIGRFSLPDEPRSLMAEWDDMSRRAYGTMVRLFPGAEEYLRNLRSNGVRLAVATDLEREIAISSLRSNGMRPAGISGARMSSCLPHPASRFLRHPAWSMRISRALPVWLRMLDS